MPVIKDKAAGATAYGESFSPAQPKEGPGIGQIFEDAFVMENPEVNAIMLMMQPPFKPGANYNLGEDLRDYDKQNGTSFWEDYRGNFIGSQSTEETRFRMSQILDENTRRQRLSAAGFPGMVAQMGAGALSFTSFIPLVGPATKAKTAWQFAKEAAALGFGGAVAQEATLQAAQKTRTWDESVTGIAAQTALTGLLGGALGFALKGELETVAKALNESTMLSTPVRPGSLSAASAEHVSPGSLASGAQTAQRVLDTNPITRNPITYNVMHETWAGESKAHSPVARDFTAMMGDAGYRFEGNAEGVPTALGGTIENNVQTYNNSYPKVIKTLDDAFADYRFNGQPPKFAGLRAGIGDLTGNTNGKLSKADFKAAITNALRNGDEHAIPQVAKVAKYIRSELFDPMLREAQRAGIIGAEIDLKGDTSWIWRDYDRVAISRNTEQFIQKLTANFQKQLQEEFAQAQESLAGRQGRSKELIEDLQRPEEEAAKLREQFLQKQKELDEQANSEHITALQDTIGELRARARELRAEKSAASQAERKQLLADAKDLEKTAGEPFEKIKSSRADVRRRLRNLNRGYAALTKRQGAKLDRIDRIEELSLNTLQRVLRAGQRFAKDMDRWSDAKLDAEVTRLKDQFERLAQTFDRGEERVVKLMNDPDLAAVEKEAVVEGAEARQQVRAERLTDVARDLDLAESVDRTGIRQEIEEMTQATVRKVNEINAKRARRAARLEEQAEGLDPAQVAKRIEDERMKMAEREAGFNENWRVKGADDADEFKTYARERAIAAKDRIMGTYVRLPSIARAPAERGSEIDRVLNISSNDIAEFLENDVERLMRATLRTLAPDIEVSKKFGDVAATEVLGDPIKGDAGRLSIEMNDRLAAVKQWGDEQIAKGKDKTKIEKEVAKRQQDVNDTYAMYRRNMEALLGRLRHTWGLPQDPQAMGYRLGRTMLNFNTLRLMGGVLISSVPDVARPIMRYGLLRTMRDGFIPLITNFKEFKATTKEVKWLAGGLDATMSSRASAIFDIMDDLGRGSKFERGLEFATHQMGLVGLFDQWTSGMKQFSGAVAHAKLMDSLDTVVNGGKGRDKALDFLGENGINDNLAERIWGQVVEAGGGDKVNGRWWPNVENWKDKDLARMYSQAIVRETNITIVTPGIDKPLWMDQTIMGKLVGQFRSFAFASTSRTLLAGMQQRDAAFVNGIFASLAFGALGYYVYAMAAGGRAKEEMLAADSAKWADEAINRSGLLAILAEVQSIAENIPATAPYATFSGRRNTRLDGDDILQALAGPTFGFVQRGADTVSKLYDPSKPEGDRGPDRATVYALRTLLPFQNIFFLRQLFDTMAGPPGRNQ